MRGQRVRGYPGMSIGELEPEQAVALDVLQRDGSVSLDGYVLVDYGCRIDDDPRVASFQRHPWLLAPKCSYADHEGESVAYCPCYAWVNSRWFR